jgi:polyamine oxidase
MTSENPLTRRRFVQLAASASAVAAAGMPASAFGARENIGRYDDGTDAIPGGLRGDPERVIIVGSGFAGLAAANALRHAGVECIVLEARARIGGRAHTERVGGVPVDMGCSWIHEPEGNVMSALAAQAGVARLPASPELDAATIVFLDSRKGIVPNDQTIDAFVKSLAFDDQRASIGTTLGPRATVRKGAERFLDNAGLTGDDRRRVEFMIRLYAQLEDANDWDILPLGSLGAGTIKLPRRNHRPYTGDGLGDFPKGGYHRLVRAIAAGTHIRRGHRVTSIAHTASGVRVSTLTTSRGRRRRHTVTGSHVLVTVPLGVLKAERIRFAPALPARKRNAIRRLGFGQFEKVALTFPEPFWEEGGHTHLIHLGAGPSADFPLFIDLQRFVGAPTLVALNAGSFARRLDREHPRTARDEALAILRQAYGAKIPAPTAYGVTNWKADPFSLGSYSSIVRGGKPDDRSILAAPVGGRILFAGEATNLDRRPATADGALSSGIREAKRLVQRRRVTLTTSSAQAKAPRSS